MPFVWLGASKLCTTSCCAKRKSAERGEKISGRGAMSVIIKEECATVTGAR